MVRRVLRHRWQGREAVITTVHTSRASFDVAMLDLVLGETAPSLRASRLQSMISLRPATNSMSHGCRLRTVQQVLDPTETDRRRDAIAKIVAPSFRDSKGT